MTTNTLSRHNKEQWLLKYLPTRGGKPLTTTFSKSIVESYRKPKYPIDSMFIERWSIRAFSKKEVPSEVLYSLFEAARWAPSAVNWQPWRFIIARSEQDKQTFHSFINEKNLEWCQNAPVLMLIISKKTNPEGNQNPFNAFDTGAAWANFALQATLKGLMTHPMGGFDKDKAPSAKYH